MLFVAAASTNPAWWVVVLPVVAALAGGLIAQSLPEFFARKRVGRERYDAAIAAVTRAMSARHGVGMTFPPEWTHAEGDEVRADRRDASKTTLVTYLSADSDARAKLAALHPWSPDLRQYWDRAALDETTFDTLLSLLHERRGRPKDRFDEKGQSLASY